MAVGGDPSGEAQEAFSSLYSVEQSGQWMVWCQRWPFQEQCTARGWQEAAAAQAQSLCRAFQHCPGIVSDRVSYQIQTERDLVSDGAFKLRYNVTGMRISPSNNSLLLT